MLAALIAIYVALVVLVAPSPATLATYKISLTKAYAIIASLALMFCVIWITAVYGFVEVLKYSRTIRKTSDGKAIQKLAWGLGIIAFRFPLTSILSNINNAITKQNPAYTSTSVIIYNYFAVAGALLGFWLISVGTDQLLALVRKKPNPKVRTAFRFLCLLLITAYTYLAIGRGGYQYPLVPNGKANFYLPSWLIVSTIIVPYAYAWYLAFVASYNLTFYSRNVKGVLYKQALRWLAVGINLIIITTITTQFLSAQGSQINKLNLAPLLMLIWVLLISMAIGFAVVASGAKKLKKIEEI